MIASNNLAALFFIMTDLFDFISNGKNNIKLEITSEDLRNFANELISRAIHEVAAVTNGENDEKLLSREEVMSMCGVCLATLWHWNRKGYLKAIKVGNKVRYRLSDVKRILGMEKKAEDEQLNVTQQRRGTCHE